MQGGTLDTYIPKNKGENVNKVKLIRKKMGLGQIKFAQLLGISQPHLSNWENQRSDPSKVYKMLIKERTGYDLNAITEIENNKTGAR